MSGGNIGMSGRTFDAFVSSQRTHNEPDWAVKIQEKYWQARQKFLAKIEKNEDSCIVSSDSKLDAKLEIYRSIDRSSARLTNILENYQNSLFIFANEENALGILLKECGKHDKTKAGKILSITGRGLTQSSHQRIRLYMPLLRMCQEMETFHTRAVEDTSNTVDKLENSRSQYRASLLWMKDVSEKINPDVYKQLDRFRRVQTKVREDKRVFDRMQMDVVQKIDLLMASRCNLINQILAPYQTILQETFERNHNNFKSINDLIKNEDIYEYEFKALKQLNPLKISDESCPRPSSSSEQVVKHVEEDLLGQPQEAAREENGQGLLECLTGQTAESNLIDVMPDEPISSSSKQTGDKQEDNTIGLLESLFGNKAETDPSSERVKRAGDDVKEKKLKQHDDLKALISSLDGDLLHEGVDLDEQIASLLQPSGSILNLDSKSVEEPVKTVDDDIFARWARDADIDLLGENSKHTGPSSDNPMHSDAEKDHDGPDKSVDLMDIEPTKRGAGPNKTRFYA